MGAYEALKRWSLRFCVSFSLFAAMLTVVCAVGHTAPAPLPKRVKGDGKVIRPGWWRGNWGSHQAEFLLDGTGSYSCVWTRWVGYSGSWRSTKDGIWITEAEHPECKDWKSFRVEWEYVSPDRKHYRGTVVEGSYQGVTVIFRQD